MKSTRSPDTATDQAPESTKTLEQLDERDLQELMGNAAIATRVQVREPALATVPPAPGTTSAGSVYDPTTLQSPTPVGSETAHADVASATVATDTSGVSALTGSWLDDHYDGDWGDQGFDGWSVLGSASYSGALGAVSGVPVLGPTVNAIETVATMPTNLEAAPDLLCDTLVVVETGCQLGADLLRVAGDTLDVVGVAVDLATYVSAGATVGSLGTNVVAGGATGGLAALGIALEPLEVALGGGALLLEGVSQAASAVGTIYGAAQAFNPLLSEQEQAQYAGFAFDQAGEFCSSTIDAVMDGVDLLCQVPETIPGMEWAVLGARSATDAYIGGTMNAVSSGCLAAAEQAVLGTYDTFPEAVDHCPMAIDALLMRRAALEDLGATATTDAAIAQDESVDLGTEAQAATTVAEQLVEHADAMSSLAEQTAARNVEATAGLANAQQGQEAIAEQVDQLTELTSIVGDLVGLDIDLGPLSDVASLIGLGDFASVQGALEVAAGGTLEALDIGGQLEAEGQAAFDTVAFEQASAAGTEAQGCAESAALAATTDADRLSQAAAGLTLASEQYDSQVADLETTAGETSAEATAIDAEVARQTSANIAFEAAYGDQLEEALGEDAEALWSIADELTFEVDAASDRIAASGDEQVALDFQATWSSRVATTMGSPDASIDALDALRTEITAAEQVAAAA